MAKRDHLEYYEGMERIDSDLLDQVLGAVRGFELDGYTSSDVQRVLAAEVLHPEDFAVLLSEAAGGFLEEMAVKAQQTTARHFGNSVSMFTPLYLANYCENQCIYCGFNCKNKIKRAKLTESEIHQEMETIAQSGLKEILLLTGESHTISPPDYIGKAIEIAQSYFSTIGIEVYPMNVGEYRHLQHCGADFVSVYQETYNPTRYEQVHPSGPKRSFPYRFYAQERALMAGMRGVSFGSLLGLGDFRHDAYAAGVHAALLQKKYPQAEISFSFPRLRPYVNNMQTGVSSVGEAQLLQVMLAYRLFMPFAGITISTRERAGFRDHVVGMAATKISAGVEVGVGGHASEEPKGDEQFDISDPRSVLQVREALVGRGLQPVFADYIRV